MVIALGGYPAADGGPDGAGPAGAGPAAARREVGEIDYQILKQSFAHIEPVAPKVISYFYARLFLTDPELRAIFPLAMDLPRQHFLTALTRCVWSMDNPQGLTEFLGQLARDHRKYGVQEKHYRSLGDALLASLRAFSGRAWTAEVQSAWETAVSHITAVMIEATRAAAAEPPWWLGEVTRHEVRAPDLAVLTVRPDQPLRYLPGQYLPVQVTRWPRTWRKYSIANAPRPDGTLDLHVRAVPGGLVSPVLVHRTRPGDTVVLGPARGTMVADASSDRDVLCIAGGTGLAPVKAIIEGLIAAQAARRICLFIGARHRCDLYDLPDLRRLESAADDLRVVPALSDEPGFAGIRGKLPEVLRRHGRWHDSDVFVSGPPAMTRKALRVLAHRTCGERIRIDAPDDSPGGGAAAAQTMRR